MSNLLSSTRAKLAIAQGSFSTLENSQIDTLCTAVSVATRRYLGRDPELFNHDEIVDGSGGQALILRNFPVTVVTRVSLRNGSVDVGGYHVDNSRGVLWRTNGLWAGGRKHYRVLYTAGYNPLPEDLIEACAQWVAALFWQAKDNPAQAYQGPPPGVKSLMDRFKYPSV